MIYEATFQKETTILIFSIVDELGRVRDDDVDDNGGNKDDDDNMPNGKPAPIGFASGRATGNGSDAKTGLYGTACKNPDVSSSKVVKKAHYVLKKVEMTFYEVENEIYFFH
ncbi:BnaA04g14390D [Brassica napus]|uniref:BnaA04g14390D protein n=1 Tax=Brassica napus TaxID=3708 RepID=A0A078I8H1_BRANA|nr:BnaA04g14390D [Brassica napus]